MLKNKDNQFLEKVVDELSEDSEVFFDIHCSDPFEKNKEYVFPVVILNQSGLYPFYLINEYPERSSETFETFDYICNVLSSYFCIKQKIKTLFVLHRGFDNSRSDYDVFLYDKHQTISYDTYNSNVFREVSCSEVVNVIKCYLNDDSEGEGFDFENVSLKLSRASCEALESDLTSRNFFVKKNNDWKPAFVQDSEKTFNLALFGGFLGLHRFYLRLYGTGTVYALTLGFFGIGWFFDCLEIVLGCWNKKGKYLMPLEQKTKHVTKMCVVFCVVAAVITFLSSF